VAEPAVGPGRPRTTCAFCFASRMEHCSILFGTVSYSFSTVCLPRESVLVPLLDGQLKFICLPQH
jgi:hypothetical protein